ncbi:MAG TPA: 4Fe-4S binding protein [Actinomycetota bacterium]|nr:4Fe-4S binding protein [Actinomycetota bacterium]
MAVDERRIEPHADEHDARLAAARRPGFGLGLLKGMGVTLKHLFKRNTVIQYPDEKQDLPARSRGVIALKEENCTVCMLCARECPDWCIYIDSHKETLPPKRAGGRPRKRNVLDRFAIDYALCMYCGICVEVCPYDALFWSREFEYSEYDIRQLTHEKERLSDWMSTVLPPPELELGAEMPGMPSAPAARAQGAATVEATGARPATTTSSAAEARPQQAAGAPKEGTFATEAARPVESLPADQQASETAPERATPEPAPGLEAEAKATQMEPGAKTVPEQGSPATERGEPEASATDTDRAPSGDGAPADERADREPPKDGAAQAAGAPAAPERDAAPAAGSAPAPDVQVPQVEVPIEPPRPVVLERTEDPDEVYRTVLAEQLEKGSSPQVAEARAKVARVKAERGIPRAPTPVEVDSPVPSAPTQGAPREPVQAGAPRAEEPEPEQGPVAPADAAESGPAAAAPSAPADGGESESPDATYERVLAEERAKGSSDAVAVARAKAARVRAAKGTRGPGG